MQQVPNDIVSSIWVTFSQEGIHSYPRALTDPDLEDVKFLGYPHRHVFHWRVEIQVWEDDREIEFIQFKRWISQAWQAVPLENMSCEMIARRTIQQVRDYYPGRFIVVTVSEDDENGATLRYTPSSGV